MYIIYIQVSVSTLQFQSKNLTDDIWVCAECFSNLFPEHCKSILYLLFIVIKTLPKNNSIQKVTTGIYTLVPCLSYCIRKIVSEEGMLSTFLPVWIPAQKYNYYASTYKYSHFHCSHMQYVPSFWINFKGREGGDWYWKGKRLY